MNNIELENKIKEIINIENYFDMMIAVNDFEKEYKTSDFYKITKKSLLEVIKEVKVFYTLQFKDIGKKLQKIINELDLNKINELLDQMGKIFGEENADIQSLLNSFKGIIE